MAKAIQETPILRGIDAERFTKILSSPSVGSKNKEQKRVNEIVKKMPKNLKI